MKHGTQMLPENTRALLTAALAGALALTGLAGCRGDRSEKPPRQFFPDLKQQQKWLAQSTSPMFADGRTMRQPVTGTVAFSRVAMAPDVFSAKPEWAQPFLQEQTDLLKEDATFYEGLGADGKYVARMPAAITQALLQRGATKFNIYCAACHNYDGAGGGMVGQKWSYPLPNFHDVKYREPDPKNPAQLTHLDGYLFHVVRYGVIDQAGLQKMPGYAHALDARDSWAVVAHIRALQATRLGSIEDVPEAQRPALEAQRRATGNAQPAPAGPNGGAK
jgi:hypothetical protein